jgi:activator of 2-hydroxyglutaryl-CoA dehydratase
MEIMVPNGVDPQLVGALGAALIAEEIVKGKAGS